MDSSCRNRDGFEGRSELKILTFTTLYPNAHRPNHGVFVENRLRHLVAGGEVHSRVVAPVPWFPFRSRRFGRYADFAAVPREEERSGIRVSHPRYPLLPRLGMTMAPMAIYLAVAPFIRRLGRIEGDFDLIDAHYFYPDGVAAALLGRRLGKPVVITARGTDLNVLPDYPMPRRMIQWAAGQAAGLITVSQGLRETLVQLGFDRGQVRVLRNGVDLEMFRPVDRPVERERLGLTRSTLISVGNLLMAKGHDLVIRSLGHLPDVDLLIVGDGPARRSLVQLARELRLENRVRFLGTVPHHEMRDAYGSADILVLASAREGWPNVLLEAMACGTPVVASNLAATREIVISDPAGRILEQRTPAAIASAVRSLLEHPIDRAATRELAERFDWDDTSRGQLELFREVTRGVAT